MPAPTITTWLLLAFLVVGLVLTGVGAAVLQQDRHRRRTWRPVPGRVVASQRRGGQTRSRIAYSYEGRQISFWNPVSSTTVGDTVGRRVEVLVDPQRPGRAVVSRGLVGVQALGFFLLGFGALNVTAAGLAMVLL